MTAREMWRTFLKETPRWLGIVFGFMVIVLALERLFQYMERDLWQVLQTAGFMLVIALAFALAATFQIAHLTFQRRKSSGYFDNYKKEDVDE